ncbi:Tim44-like domain protein [Mariprofundus micogutta]|uniref:Tim44-like domain protein n=1 Tax=Mariprofundus micogutta TaxID=1921010 RepID=A0A1L8CKD5_9PROT|nr:TIM44-like domain-containing protein [Mariprofundus micogutta]GAV19361.1 Tim44-like domain protein [Mariprofundus micogutta]
MKKLITVAMIAMFGIMISGVDLAEAKRFGMGSSFGKQRMSQPKSNSLSQQKATPQKPAAAGQRGSARGGMMGMLGGLALGGLLGAMFFGGAFEGINLFDIVLIGGALALLFMFLRRRAPAQQTSYAGGQPSSSMQDYAQNFDSTEEEVFDEAPREPVGTALRPEIDEKHFISAAKDIYVRMQKAWDSGDIEDIRQFCTPEIADRIARDMNPNSENRTEVATLNADIADSWIESDLEWVAVNYTAMLREHTLDHTGATVEDQTAEVNEVWIFQHAPKSEDPTWYLAGIQQAH